MLNDFLNATVLCKLFMHDRCRVYQYKSNLDVSKTIGNSNDLASLNKHFDILKFFGML